MKNHIPQVAIGEVLSKSEEWINLDPAQTYQQVTIKLWGQGVVQRNEVSGGEIAASRRLKVRAGQFILSRIDARNGAIGLVPQTLHGAVVSNDFPAFNLDSSRIMPEYLGWMSKTHDFVELCKAASEGTTNRVRLQEDLFLTLRIPLPPLAEQRHIVARIEELAAKIEEARGLRREGVEETRALVKSVLTELFTPPNTEGWEECLLQEIVYFQEGPGVRTHQFRDHGIRMLNIGNMENGSLNLTSTKFLDKDEVFTKYQHFLLKPKDYVMASSGATIGKLAEVREGDTPLMLNTSIIRFVSKSEEVLLRRFLWYYLCSNYFLSQVLAFRTGSAQPNMGPTHLKQTYICYPQNISEQLHIVTYLDSLQTKIDALKAMQAETAAELDALLPAVLDRAFKGEL